MKRILSTALTIIMIFALCLSAAANDPTEITLDTIIGGGPQNDELRYLIIFDETTDIGAVWATGYVDGSETGVENAACFMMISGKVVMLLQYRAFGDNITSWGQITEHVITFKAGTQLGNNCKLAKDLQIYVNGSSFSLNISKTPVTLDKITGGGPQDDELRYVIIFDETTDIGAVWATGYVDGSETGVENAACFMMISGKVVMLLQYRAFGDNITGWGQITEHIITFKAGTPLGNNCELAKDVRIKVEGSNFSVENALSLPKTFGSHMVLQRDADIHIYGKSTIDGSVIRGTFKDQTVSTVVKNGSFTLTFKPEPASAEPAELTIEDDKGNTVKYDDVLVGDVWLFAGQSNANLSLYDILKNVDGGLENQPEYNENDPVRYFMQKPDYYYGNPGYTKEPCDDFLDINVMWKKPDQAASLDFSALGFWFARRLAKETGVPVGAVCIAANAAEIQELMSKEAALSVGLTTSVKVGPGGLFNTMVNPLLGISFKGMVFFQGESEGGDGAAKAKNYAEYLKAYVSDMKEKFGFDFPFYNFQLSSYSKESTTTYNFKWVNYVRFGQYDAMAEMGNENLIPSYDLRAPDGHSDFMHSPRKEEQANRVLDLVLAKEYGIGNKADYLAPLPAEIKLSDDGMTVTVKFKNAGSKLVSKSGNKSVNGFYIGNDTKLAAAQAEIISNDTVLVHVPQNVKTDKIAYAFDVVIDEDNTQLYNSNGLPALAFMIKINGSENNEPTKIKLDTISGGGPQDDEQRYLIIFDETSEVGAVWATGYVDGSETGVENAACFMMISGKVAMLLQYHAFGENITSWGQITDHVITFKAGTQLGNNCELADDISISVSGSEFMLYIPQLTGDVNGDGEINNKDVVVLFRAVSGNVPDGFVKEAADVNDDGEINNKDVVQLFRNVSSK